VADGESFHAGLAAIFGLRLLQVGALAPPEWGEVASTLHHGGVEQLLVLALEVAIADSRAPVVGTA
jgi:hypothetical protein